VVIPDERFADEQPEGGDVDEGIQGHLPKEREGPRQADVKPVKQERKDVVAELDQGRGHQDQQHRDHVARDPDDSLGLCCSMKATHKAPAQLAK